VHKHYLVAIGVDTELNQVLGPRPVPLVHSDSWMCKALTLQDTVVLEMTTNAFQLYDDLLPHVHSVTLVHAIGVQWRPEELADNDVRAQRIFDALVEACQG